LLYAELLLEELKFVDVVWNVPLRALSDQLAFLISCLQPNSLRKPSLNLLLIKLYKIGLIAELR